MRYQLELSRYYAADTKLMLLNKRRISALVKRCEPVSASTHFRH